MRCVAILLLASMFEALRAETAAQTLFKQGVTAVQEKRLQVAADAFQKALSLDPNYTAARKNLGTVLWFLDRHAESEAEFRRVVKVLPQDPVPHLYLGLAAAERHEFTAARNHFEGAGDLALKNPETLPIVLQVYLGAAEIYDRQKLPDKAFAAYEKALQLDPDAVAVYVSLAAFSSAHGNHDYALKTLKTGLERKPSSAPLLLERGIVQALQGLLAEAEESFRESAAADSSTPTADLARGVTQLQRGNTTDAVATLHAVTVKWPDNGRGQYLYALALNRTGDPEKRSRGDRGTADGDSAECQRCCSARVARPRPGGHEAVCRRRR